MFADANPNAMPTTAPTKKQFDKMFAETTGKTPQKSLGFGDMFASGGKAQQPAKTSKIPSLEALDGWLKAKGKADLPVRVHYGLQMMPELNLLGLRDYGAEVPPKVQEITKQIVAVAAEHQNTSRKFEGIKSTMSTLMQQVLNYLAPQKTVGLVDFFKKKPVKQPVDEFVKDMRYEFDEVAAQMAFHRPGIAGTFLNRNIDTLIIKSQTLIEDIGVLATCIEYCMETITDADVLDVARKRMIGLYNQMTLCNTGLVQMKNLKRAVGNEEDNLRQIVEVNLPTWRLMMSQLMQDIASNNTTGVQENQLLQAIKMIGTK